MQEQMNIVIVGHVDHGKSTVIGRLMADTGSLPEGKLEQVRQTCERNSKPFEYAFLLDALKDEQAQGITIDMARCFFNTAKRHYIIIDAPGHIEFLKNMITGAAKAEAALLVIDAKEGVQENSRRHGYMLAMLGIKQVVVLVNKMDLVDYDEAVFKSIQSEYMAFLREINVEPISMIPISAFEGDNLVKTSAKMPWYQGSSVLDAIDGFSKEALKHDKPFRMPVQDIYKFTADQDDRRIFAGTVQSGQINVGDDVIFLPSEKETKITSIESFNTDQKQSVGTGEATGFTIDTQVYVKPGEIMCKVSEPLPTVTTTFNANIFWLGTHPMVKDKTYKMKVSTARVPVYLKEIISVLDASELTTETNKDRVGRHDVAECVFQTMKPVALDLFSEIEENGRFVVIDNYEIAGGGIVTDFEATAPSRVEELVSERERMWVTNKVAPKERAMKHGQKPTFILISGEEEANRIEVAQKLELALHQQGKNAYFMGMRNLLSGLDADIRHRKESRDEYIRRLGEVAHMFTDAGMIFISAASRLDRFEVEELRVFAMPQETIVVDLEDRPDFGADLSLRPVVDSQYKVDQILLFLAEHQVTQLAQTSKN